MVDNDQGTHKISGGGGGVGTQDHGGLREPGGKSNQGGKIKGTKKGGRREPGEPQDQGGISRI